MIPRGFIAAGAVILAAGVALGAISAHAAGRAAHPEAARLLATAVQYQLIHGLGLVFIGLLAQDGASRWLKASGVALLLGVVFFCGSLYWLAFSGKPAGPIAPLGGLCFIAGWLLLAVHALARRR